MAKSFLDIRQSIPFSFCPKIGSKPETQNFTNRYVFSLVKSPMCCLRKVSDVGIPVWIVESLKGSERALIGHRLHHQIQRNAAWRTKAKERVALPFDVTSEVQEGVEINVTVITLLLQTVTQTQIFFQVWFQVSNSIFFPFTSQ